MIIFLFCVCVCVFRLEVGQSQCFLHDATLGRKPVDEVPRGRPPSRPASAASQTVETWQDETETSSTARAHPKKPAVSAGMQPTRFQKLGPALVIVTIAHVLLPRYVLFFGRLRGRERARELFPPFGSAWVSFGWYFLRGQVTRERVRVFEKDVVRCPIRGRFSGCSSADVMTMSR